MQTARKFYFTENDYIYYKEKECGFCDRCGHVAWDINWANGAPRCETCFGFVTQIDDLIASGCAEIEE